MKVQLPLARTHARELETCGYCPKLCRATCSVSNALPSESLTPWGKMSLSWLHSRGDLPRDPSIMEAAWACCGCRACSDFCQHHNPVSETLLAARAQYRELGFVPARVEQSYERFRGWLLQDASELGELSALGRASAPVVLVVGCSYLRQFRDVALDAVRAAVRLRGNVQVSLECCGLYPRQAGDRETADDQRKRLL
ncbi:MAG TPA: (Fe-S)-binding protein, partial [Polyangiaceae bacterium]|nr:(Fe-S)-binding protein [Polyangiaceae bacterium]